MPRQDVVLKKPEAEKPYTHQEYPKVKYHAVHMPKTVHSETEEAALPNGWKEFPDGMHAAGRETTRQDVIVLAGRGHDVKNVAEARKLLESLTPEQRAAYYLDPETWDDSAILQPGIDKDEAEVVPAAKSKAKSAK